MANISSVTSLNRDNIVNMFKRPDFFLKNEYLQPHEAQFAACKQAAATAKKKSSCGCSGSGAKFYIPCVEAILGALEDAKISAPHAVAAFIKYATTREVGDNTVKLTVQYTKNNGAQSHKYEFVA
jgi:hypothetical protein